MVGMSHIHQLLTMRTEKEKENDRSIKGKIMKLCLLYLSKPIFAIFWAFLLTGNDL